jgi:hypothetical protein
MLNVSGIVLGEKFDLSRVVPEAIVLLEGRKQNLADQPWPSCVLCIASTTPTGSVTTVW